MKKLALVCSAFSFWSGATFADVRVVADLPPIHSLVAAVMGETGAPELLTQGTEDIHHMTLRPSQARLLSSADLLVTIDPALAPWLESALSSLNNPGNALILNEVPGTHLMKAEGGSVRDPHSWLDPENAQLWLTTIAGQLADLDPANAADYRANADAEAARIAELAEELSEQLGAFPDGSLIAAHDTWRYLADWLGFEIAGSITGNHDAPPGPRHMAELRKRIEAGGAACLLIPPGPVDSHAGRLSDDTGVDLVEADALGASFDSGRTLYRQMLTGLGQALETCISSSS